MRMKELLLSGFGTGSGEFISYLAEMFFLDNELSVVRIA